MAELRDDQLELLERHRERAFDVLVAASAAYDARAPLRETPQGAEILRQARDVQVSIAVSAAAAAVERRRLQKQQVESSAVVHIEAADVFPVQVLELLRRRRLPFEPADVELLLDLGTSTMQPGDGWGRSFETLQLAVAAATNLLRDERGAPPVLEALTRAATVAARVAARAGERGTRAGRDMGGDRRGRTMGRAAPRPARDSRSGALAPSACDRRARALARRRGRGGARRRRHAGGARGAPGRAPRGGAA